MNSFKIGNIEIKNGILLAPMAGVSNPSYLKICEEMGIGGAITELLSAEAIIRHNEKTLEMLNGLENINMPVGVQIFGSNPESLAQAAKILVDSYHVKWIDINMGCPVPKVAVRAQSGSALLKNPEKIGEIVKKVVESVSVPVTVKIRIGWDEEHINALEVAKIAELNGAKAITIHGRTRAQGYQGIVHLDIIRLVKENVSIPVIGNGDINSKEKAQEMFTKTNCDGIMIGRAAIGNPWLLKECVTYFEKGLILPKPTISEKMELLKKHYQILKKDKNEKVALLEICYHALQYLKGVKGSKSLKEKICRVTSEEEFYKLLELGKEL